MVTEFLDSKDFSRPTWQEETLKTVHSSLGPNAFNRFRSILRIVKVSGKFNPLKLIHRNEM